LKQSVQLTKDIVREILEKDPKERNEEEIDILVEFMQNLQVSFLIRFLKPKFAF
jgi:hypothetical protein